jgi:hypothetical protein
MGILLKRIGVRTGRLGVKTTGQRGIAAHSTKDFAQGEVEREAMRALNEEYSMQNEVEKRLSSYQGFIKMNNIEKWKVKMNCESPIYSERRPP